MTAHYLHWDELLSVSLFPRLFGLQLHEQDFRMSVREQSQRATSISTCLSTLIYLHMDKPTLHHLDFYFCIFITLAQYSSRQAVCDALAANIHGYL